MVEIFINLLNYQILLGMFVNEYLTGLT